MHILLLNQYGPHDPSPTARLLEDVAEALRERGHEVRLVHGGGEYRQRADASTARWRRELGAHVAILRAGCRGPRPDVVVSFSSPPLLAVTAAVVARWHRVAHVHWALDVYPDLAVALGEISDGLMARSLGALHRKALRACQRVVVLDEDMRGHFQRRYGVEAAVIPPWPPVQPMEEASSEIMPETPSVWLYSGNLGRAHEWQTLLAIQGRIEADGGAGALCIQGGGWAWPQAQEAGAKLHDVAWRPYVEATALVPSLLAARVLVVTQRPEARGLLWPSKLAVITRLPRPLLFIGPTEGAIARQLRARAHVGIFAPGQDEAAAAWLRPYLEGEPPAAAAFPPPQWERTRREAWAAWRELVERDVP